MNLADSVTNPLPKMRVYGQSYALLSETNQNTCDITKNVVHAIAPRSNLPHSCLVRSNELHTNLELPSGRLIIQDTKDLRKILPVAVVYMYIICCYGYSGTNS